METLEQNAGQTPPVTAPVESQGYPVDAPVHRIAVAANNGRLKVVLTHALSPLTLDHLVKYAEQVVNETELGAKGRQVSHIEVDAAEASLFNALTQGATAAVTQPDGQTQEREITREQALGEPGFTLEQKTKALDRYRECTVRVETSVEESGIDFLFEEEGEMRVTLLVGDESAPAYTIPLRMLRPSGARRRQLRDGFVREERRRKKGKLRVKIMTDYRKAVEFFDQHFMGAEGVLVEGGTYTEEKRAPFLRHFNPWFKSEVAIAVVNSFENDESD